MATKAREALRFIHPDDMPNLYASRGQGSCMEPTISDGALMTFDKHAEPEVGDVVAILFTREYARRYGFAAVVKRLKMGLPPPDLVGLSGLIVVEQLNPPRTYTFRTDDVLAVHKCVGFAEPDGDGRARFRLKQEAPRC